MLSNFYRGFAITAQGLNLSLNCLLKSESDLSEPKLLYSKLCVRLSHCINPRICSNCWLFTTVSICDKWRSVERSSVNLELPPLSMFTNSPYLAPDTKQYPTSCDHSFSPALLTSLTSRINNSNFIPSVINPNISKLSGGTFCANALAQSHSVGCSRIILWRLVFSSPIPQ